MIIGRDFAWGHMPKTGGDATWHLFQAVPDLVLKSNPIDRPEKHRSFRMAGIDADDERELVLGFRQLPSYVLSYLNHIRRFGVAPYASGRWMKWYDRDMYPKGFSPTPDWAARWNLPDRVLDFFTNIGMFPVSHWLRQEYLRDDFFGFVSTRRTITPDEKRKIFTMPTPHHTVRHGAVEYERDPLKFWTKEQVELLYESNPTWAKLERELYPSAISLTNLS